MNILSSSNLSSFPEWFSMLPQNGGIIIINKPIGITSFGLIKQLKKHFKNFKIGHSGTLDPLASGLMIVAIGKSTKILNELTGLSKEYQGIIKLGKSTPSLDKETPEIGENAIPDIDVNSIMQLANKYTGEIEQVPPIYSAVKIDGSSAYNYARSNKDKVLTPKMVEVKSLKIEEVDLPYIHFRIHVSKGFYVRKFAEDFAKDLETTGYLYKLKRIKIEDFEISSAIELSDLLNLLLKD